MLSDKLTKEIKKKAFWAYKEVIVLCNKAQDELSPKKKATKAKKKK